jgi:glycosyltransferase involved in cell wall biosynthesis
MSRLTKLHLLLELSAEAWQSGLFDASPRSVPSGIVPADPIMRGCFPASVRAYWENLASFNLVVHNCQRSIHPTTWLVSHKAVQFICSLKPDILHLDDVSLRLALAMPSRRNITTVLTLHDPEPHSGEYNWRNDLARWLTFGRVTRFVLHAEAVKSSFCARYSVPTNRVAIVPLGVLDVFREWIDSPVQEDERTVLFFGRLSPYKGLDILMQAAPLVASQVPGVRFVIAGCPIRGYEIPDIPVLPNGSVIEPITDYISNTKLAKLFQQASVVVCPYTEATQSGIVLTAYAFGKPVVATRVGGLPEYMEDGVTGYLVLPRNVQALAEAIIKLLQDPMTRRRMREDTRRKVETGLSWESIAAQTVSVYEEAVKRDGRR